MRPSQNNTPHPPQPVLWWPFVCRKTLIKEYIQSEKWEDAERKENNQTGPNINSLAIKQSQGLSLSAWKWVSLMDSVREGEGGKIWENGIETCKISCMKRVASPGSMHNTGCLGLVHWDDPEGWYGKGGGFRMGNTCIPVADSFWYLVKLIQLCKV